MSLDAGPRASMAVRRSEARAGELRTSHVRLSLNLQLVPNSTYGGNTVVSRKAVPVQNPGLTLVRCP